MSPKPIVQPKFENNNLKRFNHPHVKIKVIDAIEIDKPNFEQEKRRRKRVILTGGIDEECESESRS